MSRGRESEKHGGKGTEGEEGLCGRVWVCISDQGQYMTLSSRALQRDRGSGEEAEWTAARSVISFLAALRDPAVTSVVQSTRLEF